MSQSTTSTHPTPLAFQSAASTTSPVSAPPSSSSPLSPPYQEGEQLSKPVVPIVWHATRYRRVAGEPEYHFFKRERNSLSVYLDPIDPSPLVEQEDLSYAFDLLEKKDSLTMANIDTAHRSGKLGGSLRYVPPTQVRQSVKRRQVRADRARKLLHTLKYLLSMKR